MNAVGSHANQKLKIFGAQASEDASRIKQEILDSLPPMDLPAASRQYSLKPDMRFGWRPEDVHGAPIPMIFDYEIFENL